MEFDGQTHVAMGENVFVDRSNYANHGEIVNAETDDREVTPEEIKQLAERT
jgi:SOS-response transcriptional repressor LexA